MERATEVKDGLLLSLGSLPTGYRHIWLENIDKVKIYIMWDLVKQKSFFSGSCGVVSQLVYLVLKVPSFFCGCDILLWPVLNEGHSQLVFAKHL